MPASGGIGRTEALGVAGGVLIVLAAALLAARSSAGGFVLVAGLAAFLFASRRAFVIAAVVGVTLSTPGWDARIAVIDGHALDVQLTITFGVAALLATALLIERPPIRRLDLLFAAFTAWVVAAGLAKSDSLLISAPPSARWFSYAAIFILARACLSDRHDLRWLTAATTVAFVLPAALGVAELIAGDASFINGAVRATAPGGRGPAALAFAGQLALLLGCVLAERRSPGRAWWLAAAAVGAAGLVATATRLTTVTALAAVSIVQALQRRWWLVALPPLLFVLIIGIRGDLRERYLGTLRSDAAVQGAGSKSPGPKSETVDTSARLRRVVWRVLLREWAHEPLTGIGPGMSAPAFAKRSPAKRVAPHNDFIGVLAELGVVGLALYFALLIAVVLTLWRRFAAQARERRSLTLGALLLLVMVNVPGALNNAVYHFELQLAIWALAGAALAGRLGSAATSAPSDGRASRASPGLSAVG